MSKYFNIIVIIFYKDVDSKSDIDISSSDSSALFSSEEDSWISDNDCELSVFESLNSFSIEDVDSKSNVDSKSDVDTSSSVSKNSLLVSLESIS